MVMLNQVVKTALHGWSVQLTACPCGCRQYAFSEQRLKSKGLFGALIPIQGEYQSYLGLLPKTRHMHPWEICWIHGGNPNKKWKPSLCLGISGLGQMASPVQAAWIVSQFQSQCLLDNTPCHPEASLWKHFQGIFESVQCTHPALIEHPNVQAYIHRLYIALADSASAKAAPASWPIGANQETENSQRPGRKDLQPKEPKEDSSTSQQTGRKDLENLKKTTDSETNSQRAGRQDLQDQDPEGTLKPLRPMSFQAMPGESTPGAPGPSPKPNPLPETSPNLCQPSQPADDLQSLHPLPVQPFQPKICTAFMQGETGIASTTDRNITAVPTKEPLPMHAKPDVTSGDTGLAYPGVQPYQAGQENDHWTKDRHISSLHAAAEPIQAMQQSNVKQLANQIQGNQGGIPAFATAAPMSVHCNPSVKAEDLSTPQAAKPAQQDEASALTRPAEDDHQPDGSFTQDLKMDIDKVDPAMPPTQHDPEEHMDDSVTHTIQVIRWGDKQPSQIKISADASVGSIAVAEAKLDAMTPAIAITTAVGTQIRSAEVTTPMQQIFLREMSSFGCQPAHGTQPNSFLNTPARGLAAVTLSTRCMGSQ